MCIISFYGLGYNGDMDRIFLPCSRIVHPFEPFFTPDSEILVVGSLPSVASRTDGFYYGHPRNRFWKMLALVFGENAPDNIEEKKRFLERHGIALYDSILECTIRGSSDSSIGNVVPADINSVADGCNLRKILANGKTAAKYFLKYQRRELCALLRVMPSTSPANAAFSLDRLAEIWGAEFRKR